MQLKKITEYYKLRNICSKNINVIIRVHIKKYKINLILFHNTGMSVWNEWGTKAHSYTNMQHFVKTSLWGTIKK